MTHRLDQIDRKIQRGERLDREDGLYLLREAPIADLGSLAAHVRDSKNPPDEVTFVIDSKRPPLNDSELRSETWVLFKTLSGDLLQKVKFHTSCSQPLKLGDIFGGMQLVGFIDKNGNGSSLP